MLKRLERREAYRLTHSFIMTVMHLSKELHKIRPASIGRLQHAAMQMMHFIIHADHRLKKRSGQWRIKRALAAAAAADVVLRRLANVPQRRAQISAAQEMLERATRALQEEVVHEA